jgi:hypothetical protein
LGGGGASSPENGQGNAPQPTTNDPWYKQAWDFANTPVTESLFGMKDSREGAGGFERGIEKIASGFTSPLSLALTIGTFGTAGFLESAGAAALREAGMSAAQIAEVAKGSEAAVAAYKESRGVTEAVKAAGVDPALWKQGVDTLYGTGLKEADLTGGGLIERGLSSAIRKGSSLFPDLGLTASQAQTASKTMQTLTNAGFTYQNLQQAAQMSPRVLDALRDGDFDHAAEYATEALAGGAMGVMGASHAFSSAGELAGLGKASLRPSDESLELINLAKEREGLHEEANDHARVLAEKAMSMLGYKDPHSTNLKERFAPKQEIDTQNQRLAVMDHWIRHGGDQQKLAETYNSLAEAAGRDDRIESPENGPRGLADDWGDLERTVSSLTGKPAGHVSIADIEKAGGSKDLENQWSDYMKRPFAPTEDESVLAEHARSTPVAATGNLSPALLLNDYAHELISRTPEGGNQRNWHGAYFLADEVHNIANSLRNNTQTSRSLAPLADALEKTLGDKAGLLLSKQTEDHNITFDHEQIHHWQDQNPLPQSKINEIRSNPHFQEALDELRKKGYNNPDHYIDEIGAHLGSGDTLGLGNKEAASLAKSYFGAHSKESLQNLPASGPLVVQSLKELGHDENINRGAAQRLLDQKARASGVPPQDSTLPANIDDLIAKSKIKDKPAGYVDSLLQNIKDAHNGLSAKETTVAKMLRDELDKGYEVAHNNGLITSFIQDYMRRVWKQPDNPAARGVIQDAAAGRFATKVSMAKHRVFGSDLEGLLAGQEYAIQDPIKLTAQWLADTNKAVANRKFIDDLRNKGTRASDDMPAAVLSGNGRVVEGVDGKNPATLVNPKAIRNIAIAPNEIEAMSENGRLERHLQNGTIADITPRVHYDTIDDFIGRLQQKMIGAQPKFDEQGNSVLLKQIQTLQDVKSGKLPVSALDEINAAQKPIYVWRPQGYVNLNNPAMRGWNFMANDPSGNGVLANTDVLIHPEYADFLKTRLGLDESALKKFGPTKALLGAGSEAKKVLLSFSPFHGVQEALRAVMMGINPLSTARPAIEDNPELQKMARGGTTLTTDYRALQDHSEGVAEHSKVLSKLPFGIGKSLDFYQDFLFKRYIPSLKARAAIEMFNRYKEANPSWNEDRVAEVASKHVNDTFGGQNWKALGVNATTQDWSRLLTLAPDWLASELNSTARLFNRPEGGVSRAQMAKLTMGLWGTARVLNLLNTGNAHYEAPFSLATKNKDGKDILYSVRTLPTDMLHLASDPVGFMKGRLSPLVRTADELYSSRDKFGRKLTPGDLAVDVFRNMVPLPFQALGKISSGMTPDTGNAGQIVGALGGTATTYRTEAQKLAAQLASDRSESGPVDTDKLARHQYLMTMESHLRSGELTHQQIEDLYIDGHITQAEKGKIDKNFTQTKGLPADQAQLLIRASRLDAPSLLKLWDVSTPTEKVVLAKTMTNAKTRYINGAIKNMTLSQRQTDPTIKRLRTMFVQPQIQ